ncbi:MAG: hypothetical protein OXN89_18430 [Bryobacterales bacterium]|nr:hypothetical protein [Bryobacterales bacterium]
MNLPWKVIGKWGVAVFAVTVPGSLGAWLIISSFHYFGARESNAINAVSLQVSLLTQFFLAVTLGIAVLAFWGFHRFKDIAIETAQIEARKAAKTEVESFFRSRAFRPNGGVKPAEPDAERSIGDDL